MPERYVHLVRHGRPLVDPEQPASSWSLDPDGYAALADLRRSDRLPERARWFSSPEPKARETAARLTERPVQVVEGLREQVRLHAGWIDDFPATVAAAFAHPTTPAYDGWEPLAATRKRAGDAVRQLLREHPRGDIVLVGHGTCLALVAAELTGAPANPRSPMAMGMPDVITVRMSQPEPDQRPPLSLRTVLGVTGVLTLVELVSWLVTDHVGYVLLPAVVVAVMVTGSRQTRDVGVSLFVAVLMAGFLMLGLLDFVPRLRPP